MPNKSLVELAKEAGLIKDVHNIMNSKKYNLVYLVRSHHSVELQVPVLGIVNRNDHETSALFNIPQKEIYKRSTNGGINLDRKIPAHLGIFVPNILVAYAKNEKLKNSKN